VYPQEGASGFPLVENTPLKKPIEPYRCDELRRQCYDWWMDLGAKAIVKDYLQAGSL
jgi:hypothetical protein